MPSAAGGKGRPSRAARRLMQPRVLLALAMVALVVSVGTFGAIYVVNRDAGVPSGATEPPASALARAKFMSAAGVVDSDLDGLPDALENFVHGTDPQNWSTTGNGIPDGWLVDHDLDPLDPTVGNQPAAVPPAGSIPAAYGGVWPDNFTLSVYEAYARGRPSEWDEAAQGPYLEGLDPNRWDSNDDGIPDGFALAYGFDPMDSSIGDRMLAGPDGLSVREAFEHNTDPRRVDTDGDGLSDRDEIEGPPNPLHPAVGPARFPPSSPSSFSTTLSGVCDGYLVNHGLDPNIPQNAYDDLAFSGATTLEKYNWSQQRFPPEACASGRGLDPTRQSTAGLAIPDGWFLRYLLNPLDTSLPTKTTKSATDTTCLRTEAPEKPPLEGTTLTLLDEYRHGRPPDWDEPSRGPWWNGLDPRTDDTDDDGIDDVCEITGYYVTRATGVGPNVLAETTKTTSDATLSDSDADGFGDFEEVSNHGTDPSRRDTDADGITDSVELSVYKMLNASRADSAGDYLRDGTRLSMLRERSERYHADPTYEYPGPPGVSRTVADVAAASPGASNLTGPPSADFLRWFFGPLGDVDGDGIVNLLDPDMDGDGLLNGWEVDPSLFRQSPFGEGPLPRSATDPLNPDTDGDGLRDGWEVEHSRPLFDLSPARYDLDPSRWDSDNDGVSDGEADFDGDSFERMEFAILGGVPVGALQPFEFTNVMEQQFQTDPHEFASDSDGLGDGWKVFWGVIYPDAPASATRPIVGVPQADVVVETRGVTRFVLDLANLEEGEAPIGSVSIPLPGGGTRVVHAVSSTFMFTFADVHDAGTNPFLADTNLDGVPDWWVYRHRSLPPGTPVSAGECASGPGLDPLVVYADADRDDDGLNVVDEFQHDTSPLCADTDLDGLGDGEEIVLGLDPTDPSDAQRILDQDTDADGDGVPDFREIVGRQVPHIGSGLVRTNPGNPDSDGDGLMDGAEIAPGQGLLEDDPLAKLLLDMGVSYFATQQAGQKRFFFRGETDESTDPRDGDDTRSGVPAGWLTARSVPLSGSSAGLQPHYSYGKPVWWQESVHGPWWGGLSPQANLAEAQANGDLDRDGLLDTDGGASFEDPIPFVNRLEAPRALDWSSYPPALGLADPGPSAHPSDESLSPLTRRLLAQSYINPRDVGAGFVHFAGSGSPPSQVQPCMTLQGFFDGNNPAQNSLTKGHVTFLRGRVHNCQGTGFHGVTVEARAGNPSQVFGATFTDANGNFQLPINVTALHSVDLPQGVPVVLRGQTQGLVNWTSNPAVLAPGPNSFLTIRSYGSPGAQPYTSVRPALASRIETVGVAVHAQSVIGLKAPDAIVTGSSFQVDFTLTDSGGSPLQDAVIFTWAGTERPEVRPDAAGRGTITLPAPHGQAGTQTLTARSVPQGSQASFVSPAQVERSIVLRRPVEIILTSVPGSADAGDIAAISGKVSFQGAGVAGADVLVNLTSGSRSLAGATALTQSDGSFSTLLGIPANAAHGQYVVVATALATASSVQVDTTALMTIKSRPIFLEVSSGNLTQGRPAIVSAKLAEPDGRGVGGAPVVVTLDGIESMVTTDAAGFIHTSINASLPAHPVRQSLRFAGDSTHTATAHEAERQVVAESVLTVIPGKVARGGPAVIQVRLTDVHGHAVAFAPVRIAWASEPARTALTDASGVAKLERPGNASDPLGPVTVRAWYDGSRDGFIRPSLAAGTYILFTGAEIVLPSGQWDAGETIPSGILREVGTKVGISRATVQLARGEEAFVVTTNDAGEFVVVPPTNRTTRPATIRVSAGFAGDERFPAAQAEGEIRIRGLSELFVDLPESHVVGQAAVASFSVVDAVGRAIPAGVVAVSIDGKSIVEYQFKAGGGRVSLTLPNDLSTGSHTLTWTFPGTDAYAGSSNETQIHALHRVTLSTKIQPGEAGKPTIVTVNVQRGDTPVAFEPVFLMVDGTEGGVKAVTDANGVATFTILQPDDATVAAVRYGGKGDVLPSQSALLLTPKEPLTIAEKAVRTIPWLALAVAAALAAVAAALFRLRRSPLEPVARRMRRILAARGPHARQILLAYQELMEAAIGLGLISEIPNTARTLEEAVRPRVSPGGHQALADLMHLFELARYSTESINESHRAAAIAALKTVFLAIRAQAARDWERGIPRPTGAVA